MLFIQPKSQTHSCSWHGHSWTESSQLTPLSSLHLALSGSCASSPALHTCSLCLQFSGGSQALWLSHLHGLHPPLAEAVFLGGSCRILGGLEVRQLSFDQLLREHIVLATYLGLWSKWCVIWRCHFPQENVSAGSRCDWHLHYQRI